MLPAAAEVTPVVTFQAFVAQALQTTAPVEIDLGPELSDETLVMSIAAAIAPTPTLTIVEPADSGLSQLTVKSLKEDEALASRGDIAILERKVHQLIAIL